MRLYAVELVVVEIDARWQSGLGGRDGGAMERSLGIRGRRVGTDKLIGRFLVRWLAIGGWSRISEPALYGVLRDWWLVIRRGRRGLQLLWSDGGSIGTSRLVVARRWAWTGGFSSVMPEGGLVVGYRRVESACGGLTLGRLRGRGMLQMTLTTQRSSVDR